MSRPLPSALIGCSRQFEARSKAGALGVGIGLEYAPGATRHEVIEVFKLAAAPGNPVFVHVRSSGRIEPGSGVEAVTEVIGAAAISGAALHIVHINSTCMSDSPLCLSMIAGARARGLDVTTEAYPYTAGMTLINSALFNPGWREQRGLDYSDLELPESGERLTRERFEVLHAAPEPRLILIHTNPDEVVDAVMAAPLVAVASDGLMSHPRGVGTHARVLARYVRDQKTITLNDAIRKMSLMPAQRLEKLTPDARRLGRLQEGARADIVMFDLRRFRTVRAFERPLKPVRVCALSSWRVPSWSTTVGSSKVSPRAGRWSVLMGRFPHSANHGVAIVSGHLNGFDE